MSEPLVLDCREAVCGRMPALQKLLAETAAETVVLRIQPQMLPQILTTLAAGGDWDVAVDEGLGETQVRFTRRPVGADDMLNLV